MAIDDRRELCVSAHIILHCCFLRCSKRMVSASSVPSLSISSKAFSAAALHFSCPKVDAIGMKHREQFGSERAAHTHTSTSGSIVLADFGTVLEGFDDVVRHLASKLEFGGRECPEALKQPPQQPRGGHDVFFFFLLLSESDYVAIFFFL
jgi:hypothetical protein